MFGLYFELFKTGEDNLIRVQSVLRGGQFSTKVEPMDVLVSINGVDVSTRTLEEVNNLVFGAQLQGPMGGNVHFLFQNTDHDDSTLVEVTRLASEGQDIQVAIMRRVVDLLKDREFSDIEVIKKERHLPGGGGWWIKTLEAINELKSWANKGYIHDDTVEKLQGTVQTLQEKLQATELKLQSFQNLSKMRETMIAQLNEEMHRKEVEYTNHINQLNREIENKIQEIKEKNKEIEEKERVNEFLRGEVFQLEEQVSNLQEALSETEQKLDGETRHRHRLERETGLAAALFLDVDPGIATNADKRRLLQHMLHRDVIEVLGVDEDRVEVCGSRPSEHDHGVEVDLQIVPLTCHDDDQREDGRTAQEIIDDLMHQIVDPSSGLRQRQYGRMVRATHMIHKHEIIRYMRQQLLEAYGVPLEIEHPAQYNVLGIGLHDMDKPVAKAEPTYHKPPTRTQLSSKNLRISVHDTTVPSKPHHLAHTRASKGSKSRTRRASITSYPMPMPGDADRGPSGRSSPLQQTRGTSGRNSPLRSRSSRDPSPGPTARRPGSSTNNSVDAGGMQNGANGHKDASYAGGTYTSKQAYRKRSSVASFSGRPSNPSHNNSTRGSVLSVRGSEADHDMSSGNASPLRPPAPAPDLVAQVADAFGFGALTGTGSETSTPRLVDHHNWKRPTTPDPMRQELSETSTPRVEQHWKRHSDHDAMLRGAPAPAVDQPPPPPLETQARKASVVFGKPLPPSPPQRTAAPAATTAAPEPPQAPPVPRLAIHTMAPPALKRPTSPPAQTAPEPVRSTYTPPDPQHATRAAPPPPAASTLASGHRPLYGGTISSVQRMVDVDVAEYSRELPRGVEAASPVRGTPIVQERSLQEIAAKASASLLNQSGGRPLYTPPSHTPSTLHASVSPLAHTAVMSGGHISARHIPLPDSPSAPSMPPALPSPYAPAAEGVGYTRAPLTSVRQPTLAYSLQPADKRPDAEPGKVWKM